MQAYKQSLHYKALHVQVMTISTTNNVYAEYVGMMDNARAIHGGSFE